MGLPPEERMALAVFSHADELLALREQVLAAAVEGRVDELRIRELQEFLRFWTDGPYTERNKEMLIQLIKARVAVGNVRTEPNEERLQKPFLLHTEYLERNRLAVKARRLKKKLSKLDRITFA